MGLEINQTYARIGIDRTPSNLQIQTNKAKLEIHQKQPKINIKTELPRVEIDQYEAFASSGLKGPIDLTREAAERGYQCVMNYIGKTAEDGDTLAAIQNGGNPIVDIAVRDANPEHEFNIGTMPAVGPRITVKGSVHMEAERTSEGAMNGVEAEYTPGNVYINFTPAQIRVYMDQYASINFKYVENKINTYI